MGLATSHSSQEQRVRVAKLVYDIKNEQRVKQVFARAISPDLTGTLNGRNLDGFVQQLLEEFGAIEIKGKFIEHLLTHFDTNTRAMSFAEFISVLPDVVMGSYCPKVIPKVTQTSVVIVGGGLAGLTAALRLSNLGQPNITVLDPGNARGQIGGRVGSWKLDEGDSVSFGGTWLQPEDLDALSLAVEVGAFPFLPKLKLDTAPFFDAAKHPWFIMKLWWIGRKVRQSLNKLEDSIALDSDELEHLENLDSISLQDWLNSHPDNGWSGGQEENKQAVINWFVCLENNPWDLSQLSLMWSAFMVHTRLSSITQTGRLFPQSIRWKNGTGTLVHLISQRLKHLGVTVILNAAVTQVNKLSDGCNVIYEERFFNPDTKTTILGRKNLSIPATEVILAVSPLALSHIKFDTELNLPSAHTELLQYFVPWRDPSYNIILRYDTKFWLQDGERTRVYIPLPTDNLSPNLTPHVMFASVMDLSEQEGKNGIIRMLVDSRRIQGSSEASVIRAATMFLGEAYPEHKEKFMNPKDCHIADWATREPYLFTTYYWKPEGFSKYFEYLARSCGRIHFAGAERSLQGANWIEGAVHSGNVAAAKAAKSLGLIDDVKRHLMEVLRESADAVRVIKEQAPPVSFELIKMWNSLQDTANTCANPVLILSPKSPVSCPPV
jgi:monoamine oxidase